MVPKALAPAVTPAAPAEVNLAQWSAAPANAAMLALGSLAVQGGRLNVSGYLIDVKEAGAPAIVGKQYGEVATQDNARLIAHKFADEIILRLGGGVNGIAENEDLLRLLSLRREGDLCHGLRRPGRACDHPSR